MLITIDGGSAAAPITAMIAAWLMDREIDSSVLVTGTIEPDGTVGDIRSLDKKADVTADFGAEAILVPKDRVRSRFNEGDRHQPLAMSCDI